MFRALLLSFTCVGLLAAPTRSAAAQRLAPTGVQRLSVTSVPNTTMANASADSSRASGRSIARGSLIGFGVGALGGAAAYAITHALMSNSSWTREPVTEIIVGLSMTGAGAAIGTVVGAVVAATSGS
jgi:hypothetical protein